MIVQPLVVEQISLLFNRILIKKKSQKEKSEEKVGGKVRGKKSEKVDKQVFLLFSHCGAAFWYMMIDTESKK